MNKNTFCTSINCMDGRVQEPVTEYLKERFQTEFVDVITEPGPNHLFANIDDKSTGHAILERLEISVNKHRSVGIALVGHYDCAGNPLPKDEQLNQIRNGMKFLLSRYPDIEVLGLWVNRNWTVDEVTF